MAFTVSNDYFEAASGACAQEGPHDWGAALPCGDLADPGKLKKIPLNRRGGRSALLSFCGVRSGARTRRALAISASRAAKLCSGVKPELKHFSRKAMASMLALLADLILSPNAMMSGKPGVA